MMRPMKLGGEELLFGEGVLEHLKTIKGKKAFIVTSRNFLAKSGMLSVIEDYLNEAGLEIKVINYVEPDPSFETIYKGAKEMMEYEPDWILGIGGGSAMDAAKAMWVIYEYPEINTIDKFASRHNNMPELRKKAKMIAIPSTSGTASEVSRSVVITNSKTLQKSGAGDMKMIPDVVLLDPKMTESMPKNLTAATGMDALTHAIEAFTSTRSNTISDVLAEKAINMIFENLYKTYSEGSDIKARENMLVASCLAGMAFTNVSLGIVHSIAHTMGGLFHIPHGLADAIALPYVIEYNMANDEAKIKYEYLANSIDKLDLVKAVNELNKKLGIPKTFKEVIKNDEEFEKQLQQIAKTSINDGCTKTNPIIPSENDMEKLLKTMYYGG